MLPIHLSQNLQFNLNDVLKNPQHKQDMVRILLQTLQNFGLEKSFESLQKESQINLEPTLLTSFRQSLLLGQWEKSMNLLNQIPICLEPVQKN